MKKKKNRRGGGTQRDMEKIGKKEFKTRREKCENIYVIVSYNTITTSNK